MPSPDKPVDAIVVGAGVAGLSCARHLNRNGRSLIVLEAANRVGGRVKTDAVEGFLLNHGFQVLQTAYPEARRWLDYRKLQLKPFAPGAIIRINGRFHRVSDPIRRPRDIQATLRAPIGSLADRLRLVNMVSRSRIKSVSALFKAGDMPTVAYLRSKGFSETMIQRFFKPFFAGVCLDPEIQASSRVFRYVLRMFAEGDVALPAQGMGAIAQQLAQALPPGAICTNATVRSIDQGQVLLADGRVIRGNAIVLATHGPETARLLGRSETIASRGEYCLYFAADRIPGPVRAPFLVLNGDGAGIINSITFPSAVADTYAPSGKELASVVVLDDLQSNRREIETAVRAQLIDWFGRAAARWRHLKTYHIRHALPAQPPPMPDPTLPVRPFKPGLYGCGEYGSVPGIQWAMHTGRSAAERLMADVGNA